MNLLLDTCSFLWLVDGDSQLSESACQLFQDPSITVFLSAVSGWEITVKHGLGRLVLDRPPEAYVPHYRQLHRIQTLSLEESATTQLTKLPRLHKDPFDRMLVCQALFHGFILLTPDPLITQYPVRTVW
jgi:PIN domain nuclease of toxin-antitoxin system